MLREYHLYQVDAFTKEKLCGNPAGVVTNADGLSQDEMQRIARELNNSETAFILSSDSYEYDVHVRFFTPTNEVPICGHATIAAHYVRAIEKKLISTRVYQKTGAGILPVDVVREGSDYKIVMTQGAVHISDNVVGEPLEMLLKALHIDKDDLSARCPIQIASTGHSKVMIGIKDKQLLHGLHPDMELLVKVSQTMGCNGFYVFCMNEPNSETLIHGRMFAPAIGIQEDPVTGNANGPLGAYLVKNHLVCHDNASFGFRAIQGEAMKRAGIVDVRVKICDHEPVEVQICGNAVIAFRTELVLDE